MESICSNVFIITPFQVERIKLSHDHMEYGTGFHVKEVEVDVPSYGNHYTFPCNCWLAQDKLTEMTVKDLNSSTPAPSKTKIFPWGEGVLPITGHLIDGVRKKMENYGEIYGNIMRKKVTIMR